MTSTPDSLTFGTMLRDNNPPPPAAKPPAAAPAPLNPGQLAAVAGMEAFILDRSPSAPQFFRLEGPAGTGKTYCIKDLVNRLKGRMVFTAPTNKATKVLRESVTTDGYKPDCRTIYSLLGLRLEANGEVKELSSPEEPLDLTKFLAVVIDEGSMISGKKLLPHIQEAADEQGVKFIIMGDRAQIPPVGELRSPVFDLDIPHAMLTEPMRHDNQILKLATSIRLKVDHPAPSIRIESDNLGGEGVWSLRAADFTARIREAARAGEFSKPNVAKAIAWRNVTVDSLNNLIRGEIFDSTLARWCETDRIILLEPAKAMDGGSIAHTDDEGTVTRVAVGWHPMHEQFKCYFISVAFDDNTHGTLTLLHEDSAADHQREVNRLLMLAKATPREWKKFWAFKESFHAARHAYAITAHRCQGSTYQSAYVNYRDILLNQNRQEALRCLYVAVSRPKHALFLA